MISVALKAIMRKICRDVRRVIYIRCRFKGSFAVWFWLARIIRGSSQQVRTRRGVDRGSVAMYELRVCQPVSEAFISQERLKVAMIKLWVRAVGQSHLAGESQAVGTSIRVGMRIFSILRGLGFLGGLCRGFERQLLGGRGLRLPRKLKMPIIVWGLRRNL